ncbi:hypothetical protein IMZ31_19570 (plasmid) [Pontibacillus sp. ALD_SL1]|uniref:hypothetical protein n=1 Tax=Pontibacillus sp. ALD_SL1 TaxID=2777185 RepID=UPI001A97B373|nr:hypothetical protein [Pontibacillus sp. ALD_SL1]QST02751.1 hypothetical protein IMZ31_19570 [Pontibacillus sp. ALD_SL1]
MTYRTKEKIQAIWTNVCKAYGETDSDIHFEEIEWTDRDDNCYDGEWELYFTYQGEHGCLRYDKHAHGLYEVEGLDWDFVETDALVELLKVYQEETENGLYYDLYHYNRTVKPQEIITGIQELLQKGEALKGIEYKDSGYTLHFESGTVALK